MFPSYLQQYIDRFNFYHILIIVIKVLLIIGLFTFYVMMTESCSKSESKFYMYIVTFGGLIIWFVAGMIDSTMYKRMIITHMLLDSKYKMSHRKNCSDSITVEHFRRFEIFGPLLDEKHILRPSVTYETKCEDELLCEINNMPVRMLECTLNKVKKKKNDSITKLFHGLVLEVTLNNIFENFIILVNKNSKISKHGDNVIESLEDKKCYSQCGFYLLTNSELKKGHVTSFNLETLFVNLEKKSQEIMNKPIYAIGIQKDKLFVLIEQKSNMFDPSSILGASKKRIQGDVNAILLLESLGEITTEIVR